MSRPVKIGLRILIGLAGLLLIAVAAGVFVLRTDWFKNKVREKIASVTETATGGRVDIGRFDYNWSGLTADVERFTIHGSEPAGSAPFFQASRIQVGLKIISALEKDVDIASLIVESPRVTVTVAPDGSTNVPKPKVPSNSKKSAVEQLLDLKVRHFEIHDGFAEYNNRRIPLDLSGDHLKVLFSYDGAGPRYTGEVASRPLRIVSPTIKAPAEFDFDSRLSLERNTLQVLDTHLSNGKLNVSLKGAVTDFSSPRADFDVASEMPVQDLKRLFAVPLQSAGVVSYQGKLSFQTQPFQYRALGRITGRGLDYRAANVSIPNIGVASGLEVTPSGVRLPDVVLSALNGKFRGAVTLADYKRLTVSGNLEDLSLHEIAAASSQESGRLSGIANGSVQVSGVIVRSNLAGLTVQTHLDIAPGSDGVPVQGTVALDYDQQAGKVRLEHSELTLGSTHATVAGTLGEALTVQVNTRNFDDVLPLFPLFGQNAPEKLPVALRGGSAVFSGNVVGPLSNPRISGKAEVTNAFVEEREVSHATATFDADRTSVNLRTFVADQGQLRAEGQGRIALRDWKVDGSSGIAGQLTVRDPDVHKLIADYAKEAPVSGSINATLQAGGTFESPLLTGRVQLTNVTAYGEHFDQVSANITYTSTALEIADGDLRSGRARITAAGAYNHPGNDWSNGSLRFDVATSGVDLAQVQHVQDFRKGLAGELNVTAAGTAKVVKDALTLTSLNGKVALRNAMVDGRPYGSVELTASTRLPLLNVATTVNFGGIEIKGTGEWRMEGDYQGQAHLDIPRITFATLHDLAPGEHVRKDLPFGGFLQGEANISGSLTQVSEMKADISLSTVQLTAGPNVHPPPGTKPEDLVLRNSQPVRLAGNLKSIDIRSADFVAKDTTLNMAGKLAFDSKNPWDLNVKGRINLSILQIFNPDLIASGVSVIDVAVRGALTEPQVDGRLELHAASLFLKDLPNGVDQANGLILFDRNRATVQSLTAVTGGGTVTFDPGSFVGFRGAALIYRIQATAHNVRYRSVEGLSVTASANVSLIGTSESSVLTGSVVVDRASFNPRTDVGSLLASTAKPVAITAAPNEYLRGIQFDVGITTARSLNVQTSLTKNIQADTDLRLRGTPERPVILGNVTVSSGEIEFFGNRYTISRGQLNFYNPAKIEPIIDMDLETKVRGITVDISFSGPLNKLNFSYRSDPPLETNEIIALLAVGRTPSATGPLAGSQTVSNTNYLATGSNALLGQAIAPVSGRLQRIFGVSHIRIDPQLTDITAIPQARLTLEQQVSTDITLTYITNLAVTNQQIVRVQWDFSKQWSVVALRDENGAFSIDFQYRKRFK